MKSNQLPRLTIVVPCYNEEPVLPNSAPILQALLQHLISNQQIATDSKLLFVDDGSQDQTWALITQLHHQDPLFTGLQFSRNYGQEAALMAGMQVANQYSDLIITIDADLQDDPTIIPAMIAQAQDGYDIVYGVRNDRSTDTWFKRTTAQSFYWLMGKLGVNLIPNHSDFRLLTHRVVTELMRCQESRPFIRGLIPQLGFPATKLFYKRQPRQAGVSKYPLRKMLRFALDGILSFSIAPIRAVLYVGLTICGGSLFVLLWILISHLYGTVVTGWSSIMASLWLLGGFQLVAISMIGEYIGRTFTEVKHRPRFIIQTDTYSPAFTSSHSDKISPSEDHHIY
ncbi:glycosyltransferase [Levilactobacillus brevis]|uniref:glycosyltransferase family 2 protein n=1 Tax=Levilactobacillus brevis TaxID=1580 RepID=UPI00111CC074|nr:glycosyltransferase family 2 protein [Levilactobacillus brevis]TOY85978.1 glycosyltransferase [Levilactobacillus brevis]